MFHNIQALKNAGIYFCASLLTSIISIILNPILATSLTHYDYALIGYYSSFNHLLTPLLTFSLYSFYSRQYFFIEEEKRRDLENTVFVSSMIMGITMATIFTVFFYLFSTISKLSFPFFPYAVLTYGQVYVSNIVAFHLLKLKLNKQANKFACVSILQCSTISLLSIVFVVIFEYGATGRLCALLLGSLIVSIFSLKCIKFSFSINTDYLKKGIKFGLPLTISAIFWYFLVGIDRLFLEKINDTYELGLYNVAISITAYMGIFYTSVANTFEPDIYKTIANKQTKKLAHIISIIMITVIIANIFFIIFSPQLIHVLTAGRYTDASKYTQIIALHNITMAFYYMIVKVFIGLGLTKCELWVRIIGAALSALAFHILITHYGFWGAAWGQVLSFGLLSIIGLIVLLLAKTKGKYKYNAQ